MASIFTFDPNPPRVSSPWSTFPLGSQLRGATTEVSASAPLREGVEQQWDIENSKAATVDYTVITKLEAEPQEGPTEYKLHLLLRRRRSFTRCTTARLSGSLRRSETPTLSRLHRSVSEPDAPLPLSSIQSRQHRLEQLTTQLLWRLQQSCPNHETSSTALVLPHFPEDPQIAIHAMSRPLLPGLEESRGALYEIGVADDGTFVGLAHDEMEESLNNLRAMAASLGCRVEVLRMVSVGECEWVEEVGTPKARQPKTCTGKLWVAEALVRPEQHLRSHGDDRDTQVDSIDSYSKLACDIGTHQATTKSDVEQLRVSLTGATLSGKSSLLGSLSTSTLDNGRGKSRLSLLKHRHEIASGMTSSVTQELIGYRDIIDEQGSRISTQVISYGIEDITSWAEIHSKIDEGRLVFVSDSAGHPRFRRTTVRGLIGWDPHWTLLCIPVDNKDGSPDVFGASPTLTATADSNLSYAHLKFCLNLELPLVVILTKYDLATKSSLRQTLSRLLTTLKDAGRKPSLISVPASADLTADLNTISANDLFQADDVVQTLQVSPLAAVPIIFTSVVDGRGIGKVHAFLRQLPMPITKQPPPGTPYTLFYIEDVYGSISAPSKAFLRTNGSSDRSAVIGGHLRYGTLDVGDELMIGPYPTNLSSDDSEGGSSRPPIHGSAGPTSRSFPGALNKMKSSRSGTSTHDKQTEWRQVRITSLRNLRLPVRTLHAGQVGTMGVVPVGLPLESPSILRIRKGMVLHSGGANAIRTISVRFSGLNAATVRSLPVGSSVTVYVASVRASAKVVSIATEAGSHNSNNAAPSMADDDDDAAFGFGGFDEGDEDEDDGASTDVTSASVTVVTFQFLGSREFVEGDAKVLVLPGGGEKAVAALEGFVGRLVEG